MVPTRPVSWTYRASSARLHRARGTPWVEGNSQARALIWTTTSGGKNPRPTRAVAVVQPREPSLEEALAPLGDHFSTTVQPLGDLVVSPSVRGQEDHLGSQDLEIRQRIFSCTSMQLSRFTVSQLDGIRTFPRHAGRPPRAHDSTTIRGRIYGCQYLASRRSQRRRAGQPGDELRAAGRRPLRKVAEGRDPDDADSPRVHSSGRSPGPAGPTAVNAGDLRSAPQRRGPATVVLR